MSAVLASKTTNPSKPFSLDSLQIKANKFVATPLYSLSFPILSSETKISLLFDGFFFRYFSLQKSLRSVGYVRFL